MGDYNNNRYGVEERARKQALPFIENKTAQGRNDLTHTNRKV